MGLGRVDQGLCVLSLGFGNSSIDPDWYRIPVYPYAPRVFRSHPPHPLLFPAAFTLDQLSLPWPTAVAILVDIRGRLLLRLGRLYELKSIFFFSDTSSILNGRDAESHQRS